MVTGIVANGDWQKASNQINPNGMYLSKVDLENDLALELEAELLAYSNKDNITDAIKYLQSKKAIRMREFLSENTAALSGIGGGELAKSIHHAIQQATI
ncbi:hypothetical protein JI57_02785 [Psychromonas sp. PRT-SC03]|nr:hypothetical protein JI57_02785 [Psychromonas sp. PRT-SC03]